MSSIFALKTFAKVSEQDAKNILKHLNKHTGFCIDCGHILGRENENLACPSCGKFNYNWNLKTSLSIFFERELSINHLEGFEDCVSDGSNTNPKNVRQLSKENIRYTQKIETTTWILDNEGQQYSYNLHIKLGPKVLETYMNNGSLQTCVPKTDCKYWVSYNDEEEAIEIQLD